VVAGTGVNHVYGGGYRAALPPRVVGVAPKPKTARRARAPRPRSALSKDERKELRELPKTIERLEEEQASLHADMADPAFFKREGTVIAEAKERLIRIEGELKETYARWELLEANS
jgi:ATP-binding cassette subfamily F protein uup